MIVPFKILVDIAFKIFSQESSSEVQTHTDIVRLNSRIQHLGLTMGPIHSRTSIFKVNDQRPRPLSTDFQGQYWSLRIVLRTIANQLNDLNILCSSDLSYVCCQSIKKIAPEVATNLETESVLELIKEILVFVLVNRHRFKKLSSDSDEADGLSSELKLFHYLLCILRSRTFPNENIPRLCCELLEILTSKACVLETLRNLPESTRQHVDHTDVIPFLWPELLEKYPRSRDAGRVILQYMYIFGIMDSAVELIDRNLASTEWCDKFNLAGKLAALLGQIDLGIFQVIFFKFFMSSSKT